MRKDLKLVVAVACLLLIGLLSYVLFAPAHKKGAVTDEVTGTDSTGTSTTDTQAPAVAVAPATEPAVTVSLAPVTTQPILSASPVVPSTDSNIAVGSASAGPTDWDKTLNTGAVATAAGTRLPANTLIASTDNPSSFTPAAGPSTRPTAAGALAAIGSKTHKVAFGETLSSIAADYYGNRANYTKIIAANPGINPNRLKVGTILNIPDLKSSSKADTSADSSTDKSGNTYTVKPGDSLQRIASHLYGSADKWEKIYELNRASIGGDPHRLRVGQVLKLPEASNKPAVSATAR